MSSRYTMQKLSFSPDTGVPNKSAQAKMFESRQGFIDKK